MRTTIGIRASSGGSSWSAYWMTRYPSRLYACTKSSTEIDLLWTNNGTADYTGHKVYISTDQVNYSLSKTVASIGTSTTVTGLTAGTHYWFKITAYKGSSESAYSNVNDDVTFLAIMMDGNTIALIKGDDPAAITKDSSDRISLITAKVGGNNFAQAGADAIKPLHNRTESFRFDGADDLIQTADITFNQPASYYALAKSLSWTANDRLFDGGQGGAGVVVQQGSASPKINATAGKASGFLDMSLNRNHIIKALFNTTNSNFGVDASNAAQWDAGTANPGGITLGANRLNSAAWWNGEFKFFLARKIADEAANVTAIYNFLIEKYFTGRNVNLVWEGHSMLNLLEVAGDICVCDLAEEELMLNYGIKLRQSCNVAVGGATIAQMAGRYAASVTANKDATAGRVNILVVFIGSNDIAAGGDGLTTYNALKSYVDQAIVDGWTPVVVTMTKRGDATVEAQRQIFNNAILANTDWDYIVDMDSREELQDNTDTTYYNADQIHLVTAGSQVFSEILYPKIYQAIS